MRQDDYQDDEQPARLGERGDTVHGAPGSIDRWLRVTARGIVHC
jgi:hypothetical protein